MQMLKTQCGIFDPKVAINAAYATKVANKPLYVARRRGDLERQREREKKKKKKQI